MATTGGSDTVTNKQLYEALIELREFITESLDRKADLVMLTEARREIVSQGKRIASLERWRYGLTLLASTALTLAGFALAVYFH